MCVVGEAGAGALSRGAIIRDLRPAQSVTDDASRVTAHGKGLTEATVNQQTSFTVDSTHGGRQSCLNIPKHRVTLLFR